MTLRDVVKKRAVTPLERCRPLYPRPKGADAPINEKPLERSSPKGGIPKRDLLRALASELHDHPDDERAHAERDEAEEHRRDGGRDVFHGGDGGSDIGIVGGARERGTEGGDEGDEEQFVTIHVL